jgi:ABC-type uncharacterized transport system substrate-binding protein
VIERRAFLATLTGGLLAAPLAGEAQQAGGVYRIGILANVPLSDPGGAVLWGAFVQGLRELGYEPGRNILLELRSSDGRYDRLPALAGELVQLHVDVIVAPAAQNVAAAMHASRTIPIVMAGVGDPVGDGLVASLARPGGNVTGTSFVTSALVGKQLELLRQLVPHVSRLAMLVNPANPNHPLVLDAAREAAYSMGVQLQAVNARGPDDFASAFKAMTSARAGACFVPWDGTFLVHLVRITQLAASARLPALYGHRGYVDAGGLACYGPSALESNRRAAAYVDKILRGAKPQDLPVEEPTKFELVIDLKTAKALGLTIPPALLARADQVIE